MPTETRPETDDLAVLGNPDTAIENGNVSSCEDLVLPKCNILANSELSAIGAQV